MVTLHAAGRPGFVTLCEKDVNRVRWTRQRGEVTCRKCVKALDAGAVMVGEA